MINKTLTLSLLSIFFLPQIFAQQNTIGLLNFNPDKIEPGYTLIYPRNQSTIFLLNNCGEIVHSWEDDDAFVPNNAVYLQPDGSIYKCKKMAVLPGGALIGSGGGGVFVEHRSWENELLWSYELNTTEARLHHDIEILPNGNILMIAWKRVPFDVAVANGRLAETMTQDDLFPDWIFEINPNSNEIVWEWFAFDHIIQDVDPVKANYGVVAEHPELIDVNYVVNNGLLDWMHVNSIDYHAERDQIMLCVPYFDEMWIIDHSTTTEEAASHTGGNAGRGGDLLYRVGNPLAYQSGTEDDKILGFPHDTHWANEFISPEHPDYDKVLIFNNKGNETYSSMEIFDLPFDSISMTYPQENGLFTPTQFTGTRTHPTPTDFYSSGLSGVQVLPNENILAISGKQGYIIELTPDNELVWEYKVPFDNGFPATQFTNLQTNDNLTFKAFKYPTDYSAFDNRDLTSKGFIELEAQEDYCQRLVSTEKTTLNNLEIYPNPAQDIVEVTWEDLGIIEIKIIDILGKERLQTKGNNGSKRLNISDLENGIYFIILNNSLVQKLIIH